MIFVAYIRFIFAELWLNGRITLVKLGRAL